MRHEPIQIEPDAWCDWCGDPLPEIEERHPLRRFCSRECKDEHRNDLAKERRAAARAGLTCAHCGGTFTGNSTQQVFCGESCQQKARYRRKTGRPVARQDRDCPGCGTSFTPRNLGHKYCTTPCRVKAHIRKG